MYRWTDRSTMRNRLPPAGWGPRRADGASQSEREGLGTGSPDVLGPALSQRQEEVGHPSSVCGKEPHTLSPGGSLDPRAADGLLTLHAEAVPTHVLTPPTALPGLLPGVHQFLVGSTLDRESTAHPHHVAYPGPAPWGGRGLGVTEQQCGGPHVWKLGPSHLLLIPLYSVLVN